MNLKGLIPSYSQLDLTFIVLDIIFMSYSNILPDKGSAENCEQ